MQREFLLRVQDGELENMTTNKFVSVVAESFAHPMKSITPPVPAVCDG